MKKSGPSAVLNERLIESLPAELNMEVLSHFDEKSFMGENDVQLVCKSWQKIILFNSHLLPTKATKANLLAGPKSKHDVLSILRDKITRESLTRGELLHLVGFNDDLLEGIHQKLSIMDGFEMAKQNTGLALRLYSQVTEPEDKKDLSIHFFKLAESQVAIAEKMYADDYYMKNISAHNLYTLCTHRSIFEKAKHNSAHMQLLGRLGNTLEESFNETAVAVEVLPPVSDWKHAVYNFFIIHDVPFNVEQIDAFAQWIVNYINPEENNLTLEDFYFQFAQCAVEPLFASPLPFKFDVQMLAKRGNEGWEVLMKMLESDKLNQHLTSHDLQFLLQESQKAGRIIFEKLFNKLHKNRRNQIYPLSFQYAKAAFDRHRKQDSSMETFDLYQLCNRYPALCKQVNEDPLLKRELTGYQKELEKIQKIYNKIIDLVDQLCLESEMKRLKL